jgi:hypothetical protein
MAKQKDKVIELFFKLHPLVVYKIRSVAKDTTGNIDFIKKLKLINIHYFAEIIAKTHTQIDKEGLVQLLEESLIILNQRLEKLSQEGHQETKSFFLEYCKNLQLTLEEFDWLIEPFMAIVEPLVGFFQKFLIQGTVSLENSVDAFRLYTNSYLTNHHTLNIHKLFQSVYS